MSSPRMIGIFGSTGSIGESCLSLIKENPERFAAYCLVAGASLEKVVSQAVSFRPKIVGLQDSSRASELKTSLKAAGVDCSIAVGTDEIASLAADPVIDVVLGAIVGIAGLPSVYAAAKAGKKIGLANKESLVCGGAIISDTIKQSRGQLIPVDSEHSALFQSLQGDPRDVDRLILTASGGPFLHTPLTLLSTVTPEEALKHPRWKMGAKVTIDSSTMFNKSLEVIEAHWLFGIPEERIDVVVHPQSIVHSLVSYCDGSQIAQLSHPDMRGPISYALGYPERRVPGAVKHLDLASVGSLDFLPLDTQKFPSVTLARDVLRAGGGAGVVFNAANEVAVQRFLAKEIPYLAIFKSVEQALGRFKGCRISSIEDILDLDKEVRASL